MIRLRTLAKTALLSGIIVGLAGCGSRKGDLGAENETIAGGSAVASNDKQEPVAETVDLNDPNGTAAKPAATPATPPAVVLTAADAKPVAQGEPKPAPAPAPSAEAVETPEERAARLLKEAERTAGVSEQANRQGAEAAYQAGLKLFNDLEYEEAQKYFERALALDPTLDDARQKLRVVRGLLGMKVEALGTKIRELEQTERVKISESLVALAQSLEDARDLEERGSQAAVAVEPLERERMLTDQLDQLRKAQDQYRRVKEILNWMPPNFDLPGQRAQIDLALTRVREKIAGKEDEISFLRRQQAAAETDGQRLRQSEQFKLRVTKLLEQVRDLYDKQDYRAAERLAIRVLQIDPLNSDAEGWKSKARGAFHAHEAIAARDLTQDEYKRSWEDVEEATISYAPLIVYPSNWDQISRRTEGAGIGRFEKEEPWKADIKKKLQRKVTFEFVDTPFDQAIDFLRHVANVTMIIDAKVAAAGLPPITLRVTDMSMDLALDWILRLADLQYALKDNAIFISKPQNLQEAVELRIYDVSDLTQTIQDFNGPEMQLVTAGDTTQGQGAGGAQNPFLTQVSQAPTVTNIADMIRARVRPDSWNPDMGTSIEERGGKLVVMQRPEILALIDQLLSSFRATQKMMVNIESRFLTIREAYMEEIGVEYQGLDPNVLFGDFGDLRNLGAPTNFIQPRVPNATDATPPNLPWPGLTAGPDRVMGGSISEVGSVVNHVINFFNNDPDTISGRDSATNTVHNSGFSGQFTVLDNVQLQAFIRAMAIRENESTLIAPRLTVFNTQRASMFVARQQSYVADYEISGDSYDPTIRQFLVGVVLDVKPIVSSDRRYVTMELRPTVTELVSFVTRQINSYSVNNGANVTVLILLSFPIQFPELAITRVRTTATCPDGGILLISGLYRNIKFHAENGIPFLSDLPVVGRLFRWNSVDNARSNLAILISPRIILFDEEEAKL